MPAKLVKVQAKEARIVIPDIYMFRKIDMRGEQVFKVTSSPVRKVDAILRVEASLKECVRRNIFRK
ncbi:hypothetical protein HQ545_02545 [Candidatus Woesearchaeota archaeon]|nr:hypothetical protein [Candidatus Woesearchaeota archaeon]